MNKLKKFFVSLGEFMIFMINAFRHFPENIKKPSEFIKHIWDIGVKSIPIVALTGLFTGMILALQLGLALDTFMNGASQFIGGALSLAGFKELGPVLTALIVTSRVCSSHTAQIGTMRVTEQIDALATMSKDPMSYLVTPRVLAGIVSLPILGAINILIYMLGGYVMMVHVIGINPETFWEWAQIPLSLKTVAEPLVKLAIMGATMLLISTFYGFNTRGGADGVGKATNSSVVTSSFMVIFLDFVIGSMFALLR